MLPSSVCITTVWSVCVFCLLLQFLFSLKGMPSDQLRNHLVLMSQALSQAVQLVSKEKILVSPPVLLYYVHTYPCHDL